MEELKPKAPIAYSILLVAVLVAVIGCRQGVVKPDPPPVELVRQALEDQYFMAGADRVVISAANVSALQIVDTDAAADGASLTAVVTFNYAADGSSFQMEGVVSFEKAPDGTLRNAFFEANTVR